MRSWARFNFYAVEWPFMHCVYFISDRKFYALTHVKITRHWKSTLTLERGLVVQTWTSNRKPDGKALITWLLDVCGSPERSKHLNLKLSIYTFRARSLSIENFSDSSNTSRCTMKLPLRKRSDLAPPARWQFNNVSYFAFLQFCWPDDGSVISCAS